MIVQFLKLNGYFRSSPPKKDVWQIYRPQSHSCRKPVLRKRSATLHQLNVPLVKYAKYPFSISEAKSLQIPKELAMVWKVWIGNGCWLFELVGPVWWQRRHSPLSRWTCPPSTSQVQSVTSRGRGGRCRQGGDIFMFCKKYWHQRFLQKVPTSEIFSFCKKYRHQRLFCFEKSTYIRDFFVLQEVRTSEAIDWNLKRQNKMGLERSVRTYYSLLHILKIHTTYIK